MSRHALLRYSRLIHLYFGVFITPALLFFAFTGAIQTFGLHETNRDHPTYVPARWLVVLGQIHKKQTPIVGVRKGPPAGLNAAPSPDAAPKQDRQKAAEATTSPEAAASTSLPAVAEKHEHHHPADDTASVSPSAAEHHDHHKAADTEPAPDTLKPAPASPALTPTPQKKPRPLPLRIFFLIVAIGLFTSTLTGLYMSYKYVRNKPLITAVLIAGTIIPILLALL